MKITHIITIVAIFLSSAINLTLASIDAYEHSLTASDELPLSEFQSYTSRGMGRFLAQRKPKASVTYKYPRICRAKGSGGPDCCNKQCVDVQTDRLNCGVCGNKCKPTGGVSVVPTMAHMHMPVARSEVYIAFGFSQVLNNRYKSPSLGATFDYKDPHQPLPDIMEDPDQLLRDILRDIVEDPHDKTDLMEVMNDLLPHHRPFTRKQHIVNMTHKVENIRGTKTTITIDLKNKHHHFWFSNGEVTTATTDGMSSQIATTFESDNAKHLMSPSIMRHSLIRKILLGLNLTSLDELAELEIQISLCILKTVSAANDEGCSAIDVVVVLRGCNG
ncbi:hypothetical protein MRB53_036130 [Persea americana]|uniref:Uncharacterized protein n=1 Tax=Persea americana TaxID=3435 RepID=A0ACC2K6Z2_PERAE|nr:hypothetical protein MRB53_036130 [Persea americana]